MNGEGRFARGRLAAVAAATAAATAAAFIFWFWASARPAERRTEETWAAYRQELRVDYGARVRPGTLYYSSYARPEDLIQFRAPGGEPAVHHRILASRLTDALEVEIPYRIELDRPARLTARVQVDAVLVSGRSWQRPLPLVAPREFTAQGTELSLSVPFLLKVRDVESLIEAIKDETKIALDGVELRIRPQVEVTVDGLAHPLAPRLAPEWTLVFRGGTTVEVTDNRVFRDEKVLKEVTTVPATLSVLGRATPVAGARQAALWTGALGIFTSGGLFLRVSRRAPAAGDAHRQMARLGQALVRALEFHPPPAAALVEVGSAREMLRLHTVTDRPVVQVAAPAGLLYYLVDGQSCYRFSPGIQDPRAHVFTT